MNGIPADTTSQISAALKDDTVSPEKKQAIHSTFKRIYELANKIVWRTVLWCGVGRLVARSIG